MNAVNSVSSAGLLESLSWAADPIRFAAQLGFPKLDNWQKKLLTLPASQNRVILACGRQVGKTEIVSIMATFEAVMRPNSLIICIAASLRQSHEMMLRIKKHLAKLPIHATQESALSTTLSNSSRILALPSQESTIRGFARCSLLIIDEMAHVDPDLYKATRAFLATVPDSRLILLSTPHGSRGAFYEAWQNQEENWTRIRVTTEEVSRETGRISAQFLKNERVSIGEEWYKMEYLAEFTDTNEWSVFPRELVMSAVDPTIQAYDFDLDDDVDPFTGYEDDEDKEEDKAFQVRYHDEQQIRLEGEDSDQDE